jgi:DNA-binding transcriptional MerR regulator
MNESEKIKQLLDEQVKHLKHKREEVLSRVQSELDDIDRALRQLGHVVQPTHSLGAGKRKRRDKVEDEQIIAALQAFMKPGEAYTAAEILKAAHLNAPRFANFKVKHRDFLKTHGAKRSMKYSLNA